MAFTNLFRRQIAPIGILVTKNFNNFQQRFMSRIRKYFAKKKTVNLLKLPEFRPNAQNNCGLLYSK